MGLWFSQPQSDYQQDYPDEPTLSHEAEEGYGTFGSQGQSPKQMEQIIDARNKFLAQKANPAVNSQQPLSVFDTANDRYAFETDLSPPHF